jgi:CHAD domain-containing protein
MSYRLKQHETISDGIKRIVIEQIDQAIDGLESQSVRQDNAIHDARVCFKKIRAVLRLVQSEFDADSFRQENSCYRDAGRCLSAIRDTAAMLETFDKLTDRFVNQLAPNAFAGLRQPLKQSSTARRLEKKKIMLEVARTIRTARRRVEQWSIQQDDFSALGQGITRVYKQGRQSFANAIEQPSVENFHEWRKDVKYLRYQIRIIKPIWSTMLERLGDELETLGEYLSDEHDLALLRQGVLEPAEPPDGHMDIEALIALIDQRRGELQVEAKRLGERVYAEKPRAFAGRLQVYWQAWRSDGHSASVNVS